jgi:hypothetical protein
MSDPISLSHLGLGVPSLPAGVDPVTREHITAGRAKTESLQRTVSTAERFDLGGSDHFALTRVDLKREGFANGSVWRSRIQGSLDRLIENGCSCGLLLDSAW